MGLSEAYDAIDEAKALAAKVKPIYPHTEWIESLLVESEKRVLTLTEVTAITTSEIFETFVEEMIPRLKQDIASIPEGLGRQNAELFLQVAKDFAMEAAKNLTITLESARRVREVARSWSPDSLR